MTLDFEYDPDEIVRIDHRTLPLKSAVGEYVKKSGTLSSTQTMMPSMWLRGEGKRPAFFENKHIEAFAQIPTFREGITPDELNASNDE